MTASSSYLNEGYGLRAADAGGSSAHGFIVASFLAGALRLSGKRGTLVFGIPCEAEGFKTGNLCRFNIPSGLLIQPDVCIEPLAFVDSVYRQSLRFFTHHLLRSTLGNSRLVPASAAVPAAAAQQKNDEQYDQYCGARHVWLL
jgi:hypothetical protein